MLKPRRGISIKVLTQGITMKVLTLKEVITMVFKPREIKELYGHVADLIVN